VASEDRPGAVPQVEVVGPLGAEEVRAVAGLVERATEADGVRPLSEHVMLHVRYGGDTPGRNVLIYLDGQLAAYGHLDLTDQVAGPSAEVVVHPDHRGGGLGRLVVRTTLEETGGRLRLWAHGDHPAASALAASMGFTQSRELWQMRRSLFAALPAPVFREDVQVRTFRPGHDEEAWLAVNAEAFRDHPEQGSWTADDLSQRMGESWFDPEGFFLAERDGQLVGFHWTKVHGGHTHETSDGHTHDGHGHAPIGEVYVVGVRPSQQGTGLGKALTIVGLAHLRQLGLPDAMLYVDGDNEAAIRLYSGLGFTRWETDVMFSTAST
jgi:mycothiol synthase